MPGQQGMIFMVLGAGPAAWSGRELQAARGLCVGSVWALCGLSPPAHHLLQQDRAAMQHKLLPTPCVSHSARGNLVTSRQVRLRTSKEGSWRKGNHFSPKIALLFWESWPRWCGGLEPAVAKDVLRAAQPPWFLAVICVTYPAQPAPLLM